MPLSMKIKPINARDGIDLTSRPPAARSRLKRLFRISFADKSVSASAVTDENEPSSVCLAKMVQNFIEESNEKQSSSPSVKCGRHRCNCFNGNGSDDSDSDPDNADASDLLKGLVTCASVSERSVLAETAKIVERNGKRKDELRRSVAEELVALGYDASLCTSKWEKSPNFPAGEYEYVDVIVGETGERLIVDVDFRSEFEIVRATKAYKSILQTLPNIFVGKAKRLAQIVTIASEAARISLKKKGLHFPPWRKPEYVKAKWLSPHTRSVGPIGSIEIVALPTRSVGEDEMDRVKGEEEECGFSMEDQPIFAMSESSGEEDVAIRKKRDL